MRNLIISPAVLTKILDKHAVSRREVEQCFENKCGTYLEEDRDEHLTDPPGLWFVSSTNRNRILKIIFIFADGNVHLKSAYPAEPAAIKKYDRFGK